MTSFPTHPASALFPLMSDEEYRALVADIRANGLRDPIVVYEGQILDGRNRYRACLEAGVDPTCREWEGGSSPITYVISCNLHRRHLTSSQKAVVALEVEKLLAEEAKERMSAGGIARQQGSQKIDYPESQIGKAAEQAAQMVGTNRQYVSAAKKIASIAPEILDEVRDGNLTISEGKQLAELPPERRAEAMSEIATAPPEGTSPKTTSKTILKNATCRLIAAEDTQRITFEFDRHTAEQLRRLLFDREIDQLTMTLRQPVSRKEA